MKSLALVVALLGCGSPRTPDGDAPPRRISPLSPARGEGRGEGSKAAAPDPVPAPAPVAVADAGAVAAAGPGAAADAGAAPSAVPPENQTRGTRPDDSTAIEGARRLLTAFRQDDPSVARDFFFPGDAFDLVKAMAVPARYHRRLVAWYEEDVHAEHARFRDVADLTFDRFQMGRCVWQDVRTEGNKLPYWSCRHNLLFAKAGTRTRAFEIHVLINWGPRWYITHLGEIRQ